MSNENNLKESEKEKSEEKPLVKGWKSFINEIKGGFDNFQNSLKEQSGKNKELFEENTEKVNKFFKDMKQDWDNKIKKWNAEMEKKQIESKEQWEARKKKIQQDIQSWQEKTREDWKEGAKTITRGFFKGYFMAILVILPIIIIIIVVIVLLNRFIA